MITSRSNAFGCDGGRGAGHPILRPNRRIRRPLGCCLALASAFLTVETLADGAVASFPRTDTLLSAQRDDANWILPAKTYAGNRYTALTQIDKTNVGALGRAWRTDIADDGEQEAAAPMTRTATRSWCRAPKSAPFGRSPATTRNTSRGKCIQAAHFRNVRTALAY